jgi:hypothetical protein
MSPSTLLKTVSLSNGLSNRMADDALMVDQG